MTIFLARQADQPVSTVTTTATGQVIDIWSMATPPEHQRQGAGRATLAAALAAHRGQGAEFFYLFSTPVSKPLYDPVGFRTLEETAVWVAGQSTQVP